LIRGCFEFLCASVSLWLTDFFELENH